MNSDLEDEILNALLAQPTQVADRGFCRKTLKLIEKPTTQKVKIFSTAGIAWLILALVITSPAELTRQIQKSSDMFISLLSKPLSLTELTQTSFPGASIDFTIPAFTLLVSIILLWLISLARI